MNKSLIKNWNDKVTNKDEVYILGDFTMKGAEMASALLYSLKGKKYLIRGNHDNFVDCTSFDQSLFVSVRDYIEISYRNTQFVLFHYPILEWHGFGKEAVMLHGHQHNHKYFIIPILYQTFIHFFHGMKWTLCMFNNFLMVKMQIRCKIYHLLASLRIVFHIIRSK